MEENSSVRLPEKEAMFQTLKKQFGTTGGSPMIVLNVGQEARVGHAMESGPVRGLFGVECSPKVEGYVPGMEGKILSKNSPSG